MRKFLFLGIMAVQVLGLGCQRHEIEIPDTDLGYEYYPLELGRSWVYTIDSLVFDPAAGGTFIDSTTTWVRELVVDTLLDGSGVTMYRIERYERKDPGLAWQIKKVYAAGIDKNRQAIREEDNLRFVPLIFPIKLDHSWDGNKYLAEGLLVPVAGEAMELFYDWNYFIESKEEMVSQGDLQFFDVITVRQAESESLINVRYAVEKYARNIGLIYREWRLLDTQCTICCSGDLEQCGSLPWEQKAERGFILRQQLVEWE